MKLGIVGTGMIVNDLLSFIPVSYTHLFKITPFEQTNITLL